MKKYLTPRNLGIAAVVLLLLIVFWPKKKVAAPVTNIVVPPFTNDGIVHSVPNTVITDGRVNAVPSSVNIGPTLQARVVTPVASHEPVFVLAERQIPSSRELFG